jgi:hypothetical protein
MKRRVGLVLGLVLSWASLAWGQNTPRVTITTPTSQATYSTATTPLMVAGTAASNRDITSVAWSTDRGGSGQAQGREQWSASIPLQAGVNRITIRAMNARGRSGQDVLTVTLAAPPPPPGPITVEWSSRDTGGDAFQMERCVAPEPCTMEPVAVLALADRSWVDTTVLSSANYCYRMAVLTGATVGPYSNTACSP